MASVYDRWMDHDGVPYASWWEFIACALSNSGIHDGQLLDLGCGTGRMLEHAAKAGFQVVGVDPSSDMLEAAAKRLPVEARLLRSPMQDLDFEALSPVDVALCCFDALNYVTADDDLARVFSGVSSALRPGGVFVFDLRTRYTLEHNFANTTTGDVIDDFAFVWKNAFDPATGVLRANVTFFVRGDHGGYERSDELHVERAHSHAAIRRLLEESSLHLVGTFDRYTDSPPSETTDRETWVVYRG